MNKIFCYVRYSQAQVQWGWANAIVLCLIILICVGLWKGYKNNKDFDEQKKKQKKINQTNEEKRLSKIASLYPPEK
mgnify:CR=1 FL=1